MRTTVEVIGGTLSDGKPLAPVTVEAGSTTSAPITVTPRGTGLVVVTLDTPPAVPRASQVSRPPCGRPAPP